MASCRAGTVMFNGEGGPVTSSIYGRSGKPDVRCYNNVFITNPRSNPAAVANTIWSDGEGTFTLDHNLWWRVDGGLRFQWGSSAVIAWSGWQGRGFDAHGLNADPRVGGPLGGGPGAFQLAPGSPALDRGRAVLDAFRGMGTHDAMGAAIPQGLGYEMGPFEHRLIEPDPVAGRISGVTRLLDGSWRVEFDGTAGRSYIMQSSTDLISWPRAGRVTESSPGLFEFADRRAGAQRYFRAVARGLGNL